MRMKVKENVVAEGGCKEFRKRVWEVSYSVLRQGDHDERDLEAGRASGVALLGGNNGQWARVIGRASREYKEYGSHPNHQAHAPKPAEASSKGAPVVVMIRTRN